MAFETSEASQWTRRRLLGSTGLCLGSLALARLEAAASNGGAEGDPLAAKPAHFLPRAKNLIYLHMVGAPSHLDLFADKPELRKRHNEPCPESVLKDRDFAFIGKSSTLAGSPWTFQPQGACGHRMSELLPHLGAVADELAMVHSVHTEEINHAPAQMFLHSGFGRGGRPSLGAWVTYGLGSFNSDLPAFVVLVSGPKGGAGTSLWSSGFLPSIYQGIQFRSEGDPVLFLSRPPGVPADSRRRVLDTVEQLNRERERSSGDPEVATRIRQYEMAFRMQASVPDLMDVSQETRETLEDYGAKPGVPSFANHCLLARRLVERGVRLVELYDSDWDHHGNLRQRLTQKCRDTDQPIAALLRDLKQRGLLDETLVVWGSEFGRTPLSQGGGGKGDDVPGRDHHKDAFTLWMAGGGVRGGARFGVTDELGMDVVDEPCHVHDFNATVLHLLGLDHERLTYRYQGREFRLTDVQGRVIQPLLA